MSSNSANFYAKPTCPSDKESKRRPWYLWFLDLKCCLFAQGTLTLIREEKMWKTDRKIVLKDLTGTIFRCLFTAMWLGSQRPLHVQRYTGHPGWQGGGQEKNNRKNGGPKRRRGTRGRWPPSLVYLLETWFCVAPCHTTLCNTVRVDTNFGRMALYDTARHKFSMFV
jgi:hypothetical protein